MSKALVVFPGALGDFVCLLPALAAVRRAGTERIVLACKSDLAPLVRASGVAEPMPIEGREASWLYRAEPPPQAGELYAAFDSIESFSGTGVLEVERNLRRWMGERGRLHPFRPPPGKHLAEHFFERLSGITRRADELVVELPLPADALETARRRVADLARPLLLVHPGSGGRHKRWSRGGFAEIAARAARAGSVVLLCGPAELGEADAWRASASRVFDELDVLEVASLCAVADRYLGNDSGVSHLAAAVGCRGVALFGPTDPSEWRPLSPHVISLRVAPWTSADAAAPALAIDAVWSALTRWDPAISSEPES